MMATTLAKPITKVITKLNLVTSKRQLMSRNNIDNDGWWGLTDEEDPCRSR